jgi:putative GTP pyrophosphokinase
MEELEAKREDVREAYTHIQPRYDIFANTLDALVRTLCRENHIEVQSVEHRVKAVDSVLNKFERHPEYERLGDMTDLCGLRVIVFYSSDVDRVRDMLSAEFDVAAPVENRGVDDPQLFGYRSVHMLVRMLKARSDLTEYAASAGLVAELQIRTVLQHAWAVISHRLDYKTEHEVPVTSRRKLFRIAALLETGDELFGDFRREIERLREEYRVVTTDQMWENLTLDLDSVVTAWKELPVEAVERAALDVGFVRGVAHPDDTNSRRSMGNLVTVSAKAGLRTVGDIADFMRELPKYRQSLDRFVREAKARGFDPVADVPDVVTLCLLIENPALRVTGALPFRTEVEEALDAVEPQGVRERSVSNRWDSTRSDGVARL